MKSFSPYLAAAMVVLPIAASGCGASTDPGLQAFGAAETACDRYCQKLQTIDCGQATTQAECVADCDQKRRYYGECAAAADAVRDCVTDKGSAICQPYNGEAEVVAPAEACGAEKLALGECTTPDGG